MQKPSVLPWLLLLGGGAVAAYFVFGKDEPPKDLGAPPKDPKVVTKWTVVTQDGWKTPSDIEADVLRAANFGYPLSMQFFAKPVSPLFKTEPPRQAFFGRLIGYGKDDSGRFFDVAVSTFAEGTQDGVSYQGPPKNTVYRLRADHVNSTDMDKTTEASPGTALYPFSGDRNPVNLADPIDRYKGDNWKKKYDPSQWETYLLPSKKPIAVSSFKAAAALQPKTKSMYVKSAARLNWNAAVKGPIVVEVLKTSLNDPYPSVMGFVVRQAISGDADASIRNELIYVPLAHIYDMSGVDIPVITSDEVIG